MSLHRARPFVVAGLLALGALALLAAALDTGSIGRASAPADHEAEPGEPSAQAPTAGRSDGTDAGAPGAPERPVDEPESTPARERLVVQHVGDVNLDHDYVPVLRQRGPAAAWDDARATFAGADVVIANLECAASDRGTPQVKQFVFRCDVASLPAMRDAGVDVVTLANNHSGDLGMAAMLESVGNVEAAGMIAVGVGEDEQDAYRPRIVEVAGWRVAVLGFGGVVPDPDWTARGDLPGQATGYDPSRMARAVAAARDDADLVVATVHWGEEGAAEPRDEDVEKARAMVDAGVDAIFGHHAHRLQPLEMIGDVPVFWNLGNFVWPRLSQVGATTAVAVWVVEPDGTMQACLIPFEIDADGVPRRTGTDGQCG